MKMTILRADWEFTSEFRIAYKTRTLAETVVVELHDGERVGRGEALGVSYLGETVETIVEELSGVADAVAAGVSRSALQTLLPAGGARNALDCALWDLEAKATRTRAWRLANLDEPRPLLSAYTLGIGAPQEMADAAEAASRYPLLKLKLGGGDGDDLERVARVRRARPDADLIVDANQAWDAATLHAMAGPLGDLGVKLIEQPLPVGQDEALASYAGAVPLCADESCQTAASLSRLVGCYTWVNIKLDKTGGLTEALTLARAARAAGFKVMVGSMGGSSLSMAPAFVVGQLCGLADLDAPLLIRSDVPHAMHYDDGWASPPSPELWG